MIVGAVQCEFIVYNAHSLKDKRAVLQRVMTRLKQRFNVSVSEIDYQDLWQRAKLAIVAVSSSQKATERELQNALQYLDSFPEIERTLTNIEWL